MQKNNVALFLFFLIVSLMLFHPLKATAEKDGGDIVFKDTKKMAPVLFSHKTHADKGNKCEDCHDKIFKKKIGSTDQDNAMTMNTLKEGKFCGVCHDGDKAFKVDKECKKCHVKQQ